MNFFDAEPLGGNYPNLYYSFRYLLVAHWVVVAIWGGKRLLHQKNTLLALGVFLGALLLASVRLTRWNWTLSLSLHKTALDKYHNEIQWSVFAIALILGVLAVTSLIRKSLRPDPTGKHSKAAAVSWLGVAFAISFVFWQSCSFEEWLPQKIFLDQPGRYIIEYALAYCALLGALFAGRKANP